MHTKRIHYTKNGHYGLKCGFISGEMCCQGVCHRLILSLHLDTNGQLTGRK